MAVPNHGPFAMIQGIKTRGLVPIQFPTVCIILAKSLNLYHLQ